MELAHRRLRLRLSGLHASLSALMVGNSPRIARSLLVGTAALIVIAILVGLSFWQYDVASTEARRLCLVAERAPTLRERARALDAAKPYRERIHVFFQQDFQCQIAEDQMRRILGGGPGDRVENPDLFYASHLIRSDTLEPARPLCTTFPVRERPCVCGGANFPEDWHSEGIAACYSGRLETPAAPY